MEYTKSIGCANELKCITAFIELGYDVSIPYGDGAKYDFVVDVDGEFWKIQCKSSRYTKNHGIEDRGSFTFDTFSQTINTKEITRRTYNKEDIDYFCTSFDNKVYLIPVENCGTTKTLRLSPPQNGVTNYNNAEDYELNNVLKEHSHFSESKQTYLNRNIQIAMKNYCEDCGKEIDSNAKYCTECSHIHQRKVERPERDVLKTKIRKYSFRSLGEEYNVSDKTISKWAKAYNLPYKKLDILKYSDEEWENL